MNKLVAYLKGKFEERKAENKVKRVEVSLQAASLNFKTQKDDNEIKLEEILEKFKDTESVEPIIEEISNIIDRIDEAEEGLKKIQRIKDFLFEEVK